MSESGVLSVQHLAKSYGPFQALFDVSLELRQGEVLGFLGPNGAGKSTTMKVITGFARPDAGLATVCGHDVTTDPMAARRCIGYLPQRLPLYEDMRVAAFLDHVARLKGIARHERRREVVDVVAAAHLEEVEGRHIRKLSGGNRQRVGLAQALLGRPPVLILDEPTAGLDPAQVAYFRDLLRGLAGRHSILLSTHIMGEVEACCQRVVLVHRGRDILSEDMAALQARARQRTRLRVRVADMSAFRQAAEGLAQVLGEDGDALLVDAPSEVRGRLVDMAQRCGGLLELSEKRRSLDEVFRELTEGQGAA